jgi:hypothetical protein
MPSKKRVKQAEAAGTNPYAVAKAMQKKHGWSKEKTERAVYDITDAAIKKGKKRGK